jgi:hypothetical protein
MDHGQVDPDQRFQPDRRRNNYGIGLAVPNGCRQGLKLRRIITDRRQNGADVGKFCKGLGNLPGGEGPGINDFSGLRAAGRDKARTGRHSTVGNGRAILDHQNPAPAYKAGVGQAHAKVTAQDGGPGIGGPHRRLYPRNCTGRGTTNLVDQNRIRHAQHRFAGMVSGLVAGLQRIGKCDVQVGPDEGKVIIAAISQDDVGLGGSRLKDTRVIHPGENNRPLGDVGLVFLALFDGAFGSI